jgi:hypothetical protein
MSFTTATILVAALWFAVALVAVPIIRKCSGFAVLGALIVGLVILSVRLYVDAPAGELGGQAHVLPAAANSQALLVVGDLNGGLVLSSSSDTSKMRAGESASSIKFLGPRSTR